MAATKTSQRLDLTGQRFGRLLVSSFAGYKDPTAKRHTLWACACDCGKAVVVRTGTLQNGMTKSCGCLRREVASARQRTHGRSRTPLYRIWGLIIHRCTNQNSPAWADYGGRGITLCDRWRDSFEAFAADVGDRPSAKHSIDRIDNDRGYEPGNVRWATRCTQAQNTRRNVRITHNGQTLSLSEWCRRLGVSYYAAYFRHKRGLPPEQVFRASD